MTPLASVAMLEKFALLKIAACNAPALKRTSARRTSMSTAIASAEFLWVLDMYPPVQTLLVEDLTSASVDVDRGGCRSSRRVFFSSPRELSVCRDTSMIAGFLVRGLSPSAIQVFRGIRGDSL